MASEPEPIPDDMSDEDTSIETITTFGGGEYQVVAMGPTRRARIAALTRALLVELGEDPTRSGLADTPDRVARWWEEFIGYDDGNTDTTFDVVQADQMVAVTGVRVWTLCEHHLLPFYVDLTMAYIADERVLGLSKFARIAHGHAHRLQVQERLVSGIADDIGELTGTEDVAVVGRGEHLCMTMRGVKTPGTMHSSVLRGRFREDAAARAELFALVPTS